MQTTSAIDSLKEIERRKRDEIAEKITTLRQRRDAAALDLAGAREILVEAPENADATVVATEASALVSAYNAKLAQFERDLRKLDAHGDDEERRKFGARLDKMRVDYAALREDQRREAIQFGEALAKLFLAGHQKLKADADQEQARVRDARSLASFLEPTLSANEITAMGLGGSGFGGLRRAARDAFIVSLRKSGLMESEVRVFFDL